MKTRILQSQLCVIAGIALWACSAGDAAAQNPSNSTTAPDVTQAASPSQPSKIQLSYGVEDVLKLQRANVSDDTIVAFIVNSGRVYTLSASEIVYLREQKLSDRVLTAMLTQRKRGTEAAPLTAQQAPDAPTNTQPPVSTVPAAPAYGQPSTVYVQPEPAYVPSSPVYVAPAYGYYGYPYYGGYGYGYPSLSLAFGIGGYYGGYYHGGYYHGGGSHGGGYYGGGSHGGGSHGGGSHGGGHH